MTEDNHVLKFPGGKEPKDDKWLGDLFQPRSDEGIEDADRRGTQEVNEGFLRDRLLNVLDDTRQGGSDFVKIALEYLTKGTFSEASPEGQEAFKKNVRRIIEDMFSGEEVRWNVDFRFEGSQEYIVLRRKG